MTFDYAPAPESRDLVTISNSYGLFIDGEFVDGSGTPFKTINPATEEVLTELSEASAADVDAAVRAARKAYTRVWSKMSGAERGKYLFRIARILQERAREFAVLESLDNGKPIKESRDVDVPIAAAHFFYYAGWADKLQYAGYGTQPLVVRQGLSAGGPPPGCGQHRHRSRSNRTRDRGTPRRRQGGLHRLHRGGQGDRQDGGR